jgi:hypothetical protein
MYRAFPEFWHCTKVGHWVSLLVDHIAQRFWKTVIWLPTPLRLRVNHDIHHHRSQQHQLEKGSPLDCVQRGTFIHAFELAVAEPETVHALPTPQG